MNNEIYIYLMGAFFFANLIGFGLVWMKEIIGTLFMVAGFAFGIGISTFLLFLNLLPQSMQHGPFTSTNVDSGLLITMSVVFIIGNILFFVAYSNREKHLMKLHYSDSSET